MTPTSFSNIQDYVDLSDADYIDRILAAIKAPDVVSRLDELDDTLLNHVELRPKDVERICRINLQLFLKIKRKRHRNELLGYSYNTLLVAIICQKDVTKAIDAFKTGIEFCRKHRLSYPGKSIAGNIFRIITTSQLPQDEALYLLSQVTRFYLDLRMHDSAIEALCAAAMHFGEISAYQSAYRALHDAQNIALNNKLFKQQARVLETQASVALYEGDLKCSEADFNTCISVLKKLGEQPSPTILANLALVQLRLEKYEDARKRYEDLISQAQKDIQESLIRSFRLNLLICYRELKNREKTDELVIQVECDLSYFDREERIEAFLVLAKTSLFQNNSDKCISFLNSAVLEIELELEKYQRLHLRRGIRERYINRIKKIFSNISSSAAVTTSLEILVFIRSNALTDWLSVLHWVQQIQSNPNIDTNLKQTFLKKTDDLIKFGTPVLYGFREKYDDPFEQPDGEIKKRLGEDFVRAIDLSLPWREFNEIVATIRQAHALPSPFHYASVKYCSQIIQSRINKHSVFLFSFMTDTHCNSFLITNNELIHALTPSDQIWDFGASLWNYQKQALSRHDFTLALENIFKQLSTSMQSIVSKIEDSNAEDIILLA